MGDGSRLFDPVFLQDASGLAVSFEETREAIEETG